MPGEWVVLLEAAGDAAAGPIDRSDVERLHGALGPGAHGGALHSPNRYALQVTAAGASPVAALLDVVARWSNALSHLQLPAWDLVRTEVFTPEELKRELETAHRRDVGVERPEADGSPEDHDQVGHDLLDRAFGDPLTGLLGRQAFAHRLEAALVPRDDGRGAVGVMCLDLDDFEGVNHLLGRAAGDDVLIDLAHRLSAMVRPRDVLARFGGDEYGVLLEDGTEDTALALAERLLEAVRLPMTIVDHDLTLSASAGVALSRPGDSADTVMANAVAALSAAKAAGGGRPVLYGSDVSHGPQRPQDSTAAAGQDRLAHLQLMQQAAIAANEADTLDQAAQVVMRHICAQVGCAAGQLCVSPATDELRETPLWHFADGAEHQALQKAAQEIVARPRVGLAARVLATGHPVSMPDVADNDGHLARAQATAGLQSAFAFPITVRREVVATLAFFSRSRLEPTDSFLDVMAGIGTQLGRVVERQRAAEAIRRAAEQLRVAEARHREAQKLARLGSWHFDIRTGEGSFSEGTAALLGIDPQGALDLGSALAAVHPDDRSRAEADVAQVVETGEPTVVECRIVRGDGEVRWHRAYASLIRDDDGVAVAVHGTNQDITEQKQVEEDLRSTKAMYQRIIETTREGIITLDAQDIITFVNPRMAQMLGYAVDEMTGVSAWSFVDEEARALLRGRQQRRRDGMSERYQTQVRTRDGAVVEVLISASPFMDENDNYAGVLAMVTDVSNVRDAEDIVRSTSRRIQAGLGESAGDRPAR